jgi:transglutaminase-like putative cysteine protease
VSALAETVAIRVYERGLRRADVEQATPTARPWVRLATFFALGLYGALRWATLVTPMPAWRMLALLGLAGLAAGTLGAGVQRGGRWRVLAVLGAGAILVISLPAAGVPMHLVTHLRIRVIADGIGLGLAGLPRVLVPYGGINEWVRTVIVLGGGVLLLDAGMLLAFAPQALGDARRAGAALPLIALAVVPSALARPQLAYLHGFVLFALVAAFVWGERLPRRELPAALVLAGLAAGAGLVAAPAIDRHRAWFDYQSIAGSFSAAHVETFDWSQHYGPLNWSQTGQEVLRVQAARPDYWKAENLDLFDGTRWVRGLGTPTPAAPAAIQARWTQTLQVTIRGLRSSDVVAGGFASMPQDVPGGVIGGQSPGTWTAVSQLGPGDTYLVSTYSPRPPHAELAGTGTSYPPELGSYRAIMLPRRAGPPSRGPVQIAFPAFHSSAPALTITDVASPDGAAVMAGSPYARVYALATSLARTSLTPIAFVERVQSYLAHGYTYSQNAPDHKYPLASFLFGDKLGYCQQFSGAMALLLRMGGVPARVAAGFSSGTYSSDANQWVVRDLDAHAWVEAWFPRYGWVRFDPTPGAAPARGGRGFAAADLTKVPPAFPGAVRRAETPAPRAPVAGVGGSSSTFVDVPVAVLLAIAGFATLGAAARPVRVSGDRLVAELERALARSGRPLAPGTTLAALEERFRSSPDAAGYIRALRVSRYAGTPAQPTAAQRRALRARLADGLGWSGRLRALWALPPRRAPESGRKIRLPPVLN